MKKILLPQPTSFFLPTLLILLFSYSSFCQTVQIVANSGQSVSIVVGNNNNHVSEAIYTENEIGATNFTTAATAINHIDFSVFVVSSIPLVNNFKIYLKEVPLATKTLSTGLYSTAGYTLVYSGSVNFNATGWIGVDLSTTFTRNAGNNLELLIERFDNITHTSANFNASRGNDTDPVALTSRRVNSATIPISGTTSLTTASAFRPRLQLRHVYPNDARLTQIYTLGKLPIPFATPHTISANVINNGGNTLSNLAVTLDITGANTFNDVQNIASLLPGASTTVSFNTFTPANIGNNTINISLPADDYTGDNILSVSQETTNNTYNYAYTNTASGSVGVAGKTVDFVAMFTTSSPTTVNQAGVRFTASGQPFKIGIWNKSGTGLPGALLWESDIQTTTLGIFTLPISPAIPVTDTFYIGVRQIDTFNIQFAYESENPARPKTFFSAQPGGSNTWVDFSPNSTFRLMIEPRLTVANDVGVSSIKDPLAATSIDNCGIVPQAAISNFGSNNQTTPFDVTYIIKQSGTSVYSDTKSISLNSGETKRLYFTPFTGSASGNDSAFVFTSLVTDAATNNDTVFNKFSTGNFSYADSVATSGGYSFANSTACATPSLIKPTYSWITETTNEINWAANGNDSVLATPIVLTFPFKYFANTYSQFWIGSNGWISFSDANSVSKSSQRTPANIPAAGGLENYIAGILTNLDLTTATYPDAHTYYGGNASQFVITFLHAHRLGSAVDYISFQIVLKVNGDILVQYNDLESSMPIATDITNFCSAGIENSNGTKGISYRVNGNGGSIFESPIAVLFKAPQTPLPVSLLNFTAQKNNRVNKISWSTSQEINTNSFTVEHSIDGINFIAIGLVAANGNSTNQLNYSFTDQTPAKGQNYYRLLITDIDGKVGYSPIRNVRNEGTVAISIYPIPVRNNINLLINADDNDKAVVSITDGNGKLMLTKTVTINSGNNKLLLSSDALPTGTYFVKIQLQSDVVIKKFSKL
jgi:hypothetical protein